MKKIKSEYLNQLLEDLYDKSFTTKKGTYNPNDPTHWEHRELSYQGNILIMKDNTWGIEFCLNKRDVCYLSIGCFGTKTEVIYRDNFQKGDWTLLKEMNDHINFPEPQIYEMDPAGGYGLWSHE